MGRLRNAGRVIDLLKKTFPAYRRPPFLNVRHLGRRVRLVGLFNETTRPCQWFYSVGGCGLCRTCDRVLLDGGQKLYIFGPAALFEIYYIDKVNKGIVYLID
jgi:hypothetical protein